MKNEELLKEFTKIVQENRPTCAVHTEKLDDIADWMKTINEKLDKYGNRITALETINSSSRMYIERGFVLIGLIISLIALYKSSENPNEVADKKEPKEKPVAVLNLAEVKVRKNPQSN